MLKWVSILAIILWLCVGCTDGLPQSVPETDEEIHGQPAQKATLIFPVSVESSTHRQYAENLLLEQGIAIEFMGYDKDSGYLDFEHYLAYCKEIYEGRNNVFVIYPAEFHRWIGHYQDLFQEISAVYQSNAPRHHDRFIGFNDTAEQFGVPIALDNTNHRLAILIRNEYLAEYKEPITTAKEYEAFLNWASQYIRDGRKPGAFPLFVYEMAYHNAYVPFELFMPEWGYISLSPAFPINIGGLYAPISQVHANASEIKALEGLPHLKEGVLRLRAWMDNGWMDAKNPMEWNAALIEQYASLIVNTGDYSTRNLDYWFPDRSMRVDARDCTLFVLYPDQLPNPREDRGKVLYYAAMMKGTEDPGSFFTFIEWLYSNEGNYRLFTGQETAVQDPMPLLEKSYGQWSALSFFQYTPWTRSSPFAPSNYAEAMTSITNTEHPLVRYLIHHEEDVHKLMNTLFDRADYQTIGERENAYIDLFRTIFIRRHSDPESILDSFYEQRNPRTQAFEAKIQRLFEAAE